MYISRLFLALTALSLSLACGSSPKTSATGFEALIGSSDIYTLTALHPDDQRLKLYAVNYQMESLLPICTQVQLIDLNRKALRFKVIESDRAYTYLYHKAAAEPFTDHLARFFGPKCPDTSSLSDKDKEGIRLGKASVGMTRAGVIFAMGHPPKHVNPTPDTAPTWTYWRNKFGKRAVSFDGDGKVSSVR